MPLTRVATWHNAPNPALVLQIGTTGIQLTQAALDALDTEEGIETAIATLAAGAGITLPAIFIHINKDGTIALATGTAPDVWPEDAEPPGD